MSSGSATFWSGIVRVTRSTRPGSSSVERVMGDTVHPGQTALTRPPGAIRTISFLRLRRSRGRLPTWPTHSLRGQPRSPPSTDEDEAPVTAAFHFTEEAARGQEGRGQVGGERLLPAVEAQAPERDVLFRPDAGDRDAHVEPTESGPRLVEGCRPPPRGSGSPARTVPALPQSAATAAARSRPRW